ncbi:MAG TPA: hypothetical protein VGI03_06190 [Verrucomicrobiae bacterium]|jgi:hypothetical protein
MKPSQFVANGGWIKRQSVGRLRMRFFGILSLLWLVPSALFVHELIQTGWPSLSLDQKWECVLLPIPEPIFIVLAIVYAFVEKPKTITSHLPNPDHDIRKLY